MVFHSDDYMLVTIAARPGALEKNQPHLCLKSNYYVIKHSNALKADLRLVKECIQWPEDSVSFGYHISPRGNGTDRPR